MKLVARAPIEGVAEVKPDQRPGDTFEADAKVAKALIDAGKAEEVKPDPNAKATKGS